MDKRKALTLEFSLTLSELSSSPLLLYVAKRPALEYEFSHSHATPSSEVTEMTSNTWKHLTA